MARHKQPQLLEVADDAGSEGPVECLGMSFPNDAARRTHYLGLLRENLHDPAFRKLPGFPLVDDETILDLSDPPYYTLCPNPFLADVIARLGKPYDESEAYHSEPFAADVTAGKNDTIYMAHSYHTKVPHGAIVRYILHYTQPGDLVLDGFCGSGMTGIACTLCGDPTPEERAAIEKEMPGVEWGKRIAILNDLSPAASFIAHNYNVPVEADDFEAAVTSLLDEIEAECGHLYRTAHDGKNDKLPGVAGKDGLMNYTVWSEVMLCPQCGQEIVFFDHAVDTSADPLEVRSEFPCPECGVTLTKRALEPFKETVFDPLLERSIERVKRVPVFVKYMVGKTHLTKKLDADDLKRLSTVRLDDPAILPALELSKGSLSTGNEADGLTHLHHYFTPRNFLTISKLLAGAKGRWRRQVFNLVQSVSMRLCSHLTTYQLGKRGNVPMTGTLFVASLIAEANPLKALEGKLRDFLAVYRQLHEPQFVSCGSSTNLPMLPDASIDYIFIDPPFGDNLNYAQLNAVWEGWLRAQTDVSCEAIVNRSSQRDLAFYQEALRQCLTEFYRVLKPGRWMTVVFHNSKNAVWNAIQEAILQSQFVIADVRTLDKKQGTPKQVNSTNAVKQDLVISAYKPTKQFEERFTLKAGTDEGIWDFVAEHLRQLPVFVERKDRAEAIAEREKHLLFDRMIAFHVQRGISVPMSAGGFYTGLAQRYPERDSMFFLPDQVAEYDQRRMSVAEVEQLQLFVSDEKSAIQWVRQQLQRQPMTFQQLQPLYMKEAQRAWEKQEEPIELLNILNENFVRDADDCWRTPDAGKEADLEQLRNRHLLKEFDQYRATKGKLKVVRSEALRAGFKDCWQKGDYTAIVEMARRVPSALVQEDSALLMYYDNAVMRTEE